MNGCLQLIGTYMTQDAKRTIIDALLTLNLRMWQGACRCSFSQHRLPISEEWMTATNRNMNYPKCEAENCWRSIDTNSQNGAVTVFLSLLPMKASNTSVMHNSDRITVKLPYLQNHKLLTLHWHSFQSIVQSTSAAIDNSFHHDLNQLVVILTDWELALWQSQVQ